MTPDTGELVGVLLAAGASRRFGADDKLLANWRGAPLVRVAAEAMLAAPCDRWHAIVSHRAVASALPPQFQPRTIAPGLPLSASFHAAIDLAEGQDAERLLIALGDMPLVPPAIFGQLARAQRSAACLCGANRMPPLILHRQDYAQARAAAEGDRGAHKLLATFHIAQLVPLAAPEALDIDEPADLRIQWAGERNRILYPGDFEV